jgi:hypothetical protein
MAPEHLSGLFESGNGNLSGVDPLYQLSAAVVTLGQFAIGKV